ncbi:MAG: response regulator [Hyphomonadaceae bacterium]
MRVLLAEDNQDNREMLARRLARRGFIVDVAEDGALAVAAANNNKPDVVLLDLAMPVMSGLEAARALRAAPETADVKIIALTAQSPSEARQSCLEAGCDAFAAKPVDFQALLETIEALMGER